MIERQIEDIKNALRQMMEFISSQGSEPPPEIVQLIEQVMQHAAQRIQELREQEPILTPPPELDQAPYPSSNINAFKYDDKNKKLFVKFQDKYPGTNGPIYSYDNVPPFIFDVFSRGAVAPKTSGKNDWHEWKKGVTPSLGASMAALIKNGGYQYQRLS